MGKVGTVSKVRVAEDGVLLLSTQERIDLLANIIFEIILEEQAKDQ